MITTIKGKVIDLVAGARPNFVKLAWGAAAVSRRRSVFTFSGWQKKAMVIVSSEWQSIALSQGTS